MPDRKKYCPKCNREMEGGFVADVTDDQVRQSSWSAGTPIPRKFIGGVKWRSQDSRPIVTYRCTGCGFLESYAE